MVSVIEQRMTRLVSLKFSGVTAANAPRPMRELEWNIRDDDTTVLPGKQLLLCPSYHTVTVAVVTEGIAQSDQAPHAALADRLPPLARLHY